MKKYLYNLSIKEFLEKIPFKENRIGGGSVACLCGALSVSLFQLVVDFSFKNKNRKTHLRKKLLKKRLDTVRKGIEKLIDEDARAFYRKDDYVSACKVCIDCFVLLRDFYSVLQSIRKTLNERLLADIVLAEKLFLASLENVKLNLEENEICMRNLEKRKVYCKEIKDIKRFYNKINFAYTRKAIKKRYGTVT